ncbi:AVN_HP_G0045710.mRNA.1.CDS.1 [Saccharomyces cerevisiae]|nr:AVN_HP_G0045710.mRNA.1.CDS.1 [Saccharomyces cerevisiae]CAI6911514.1 AVN_HP_G0045710.mRNA.1.CDS.1 [Saccharomyces cerevisiae]
MMGVTGAYEWKEKVWEEVEISHIIWLVLTLLLLMSMVHFLSSGILLLQPLKSLLFDADKNVIV